MVGMKNKIILIILIGVLSLQIFPTQWLSMISDDTTSIQYLASGESEEDIDDEPGKDAKIKFLENNFLIVSPFKKFSKTSFDFIIFSATLNS